MTRQLHRREARAAILQAAHDAIAVKGVQQFQTREVCEDLGLSKALVNYHFGSRDGLIAEAMVLGYTRYVDTLWAAAEAAGSDPLARLTAWIDTQVEWTAHHPGLAAALDFPEIASGIALSALDGVVERLSEVGNRNFANLQTLVGAAMTHLRASAGRPEPSRAEIGLNAALVGWSTLGMAVWTAGRHLPTRQVEGKRFYGVAREHVRNQLLEILAR